MNFLINAQIPNSLTVFLNSLNHDSKHTLLLPSKNQTPDFDIINFCISEERILITKDKDFIQDLIFGNLSFKLLLITSGNISNNDLILLINNNLNDIINAFESSIFVEIDNQKMTIHF